MRVRHFCSILFVFCLSLPVWIGVAHADPTSSLTVSRVWARASAGMARAGAAFMIIDNSGPETDALIAASAPVSAVVELHTHVNDGGMMRMRQVDRITVPAQGRTELKPGGLHVMFIGLKAPLVEDTHFDLSLVFEKAGRIVVPVTVKSVRTR
ncbi:MAG: copper chaperone PCu(A)C [Rhodospirillaceae bacterium]|nr:copper chaperone PCu(A)C [Rhodospirillaceae bacterium]